MATASTGWIILQFSIRAHETLPLTTFWLFRVYHENQSTEHFMSPTALKTSGYLHGTCKSFLFLWLDWRLGEASCVVTLLAQSDPKPNFNTALFCHCFFLNIILPHNFIFNIQLFLKKVTTQKCSIAHLRGFSNFQCCQWKESFPAPSECRITQKKLIFSKHFN